MAKQLQVYLTESYFSVKVSNGVTRETSGNDIGTVLDSMPTSDKETLLRFCDSVSAYLRLTSSDNKEKARIIASLKA